jgi:chromosome segregation ATPase
MSEEKLDVIIKQLGELQTSVGGINTRIDGLDARMGGLETKVSGLDARMGGLETKVSRLETQVSGLDARMGGLETQLSGLDARMGGLETQLSGLDARMGGLEKELSGLDARMGGLEKELSDFKKQVLKSLQTLQTRINTLEKQLFAIGFELKEDIKREIKDVREDILNLGNKVILQKADRIKDQVVVREIDLRVLQLELLAA